MVESWYQYTCPICKKNVLNWKQFQGMMLTTEINNKTYYMVDCKKCGQFEIKKGDVRKLKVWNK